MQNVRPMLERYLICHQFGACVYLFNIRHGIPMEIKYVRELVESNPDKYW